ncbi:hypothetical protein T265_07171 [Opisthorchis viverrini]|uniref:Uncharacterized protein n=1 Tax=Opisthorchis viverrini TaxID=6198 RepID=A0A074ZDJ9_OPIVI|nr:hypothetical protein T265_07171 [Opisthorchis viverrini]KER25371.1 hypothetical protein T265_07171 [Opisthorchis viverrini]
MVFKDEGHVICVLQIDKALASNNLNTEVLKTVQYSPHYFVNDEVKQERGEWTSLSDTTFYSVSVERTPPSIAQWVSEVHKPPHHDRATCSTLKIAAELFRLFKTVCIFEGPEPRDGISFAYPVSVRERPSSISIQEVSWARRDSRHQIENKVEE